MKTVLTITDLTRMQQRRVCIAGIDDNGLCIRPVLPPPGIPESALYKDGIPIIFPSARVELILLKPRSQPPHTEDIDFVVDSLRFIERVKNMEDILKKGMFRSVGEIFGQPTIHNPGYSVMDCAGPRSIGTIRPARITQIFYGHEATSEAWDYRLVFEDGEGETYRLKITDLTFHYYCDNKRSQGDAPFKIAEQLSSEFKSMRVYLRIGLSRGWKKYPDRCFLQINSIHTFPDYLGGKVFADFVPHS